MAKIYSYIECVVYVICMKYFHGGNALWCGLGCVLNNDSLMRLSILLDI